MRTSDAHVLLPIPCPAAPRPASTIVAKDTVPYVRALLPLPSGDLLVVEDPGLAAVPGRLLRRNATSFAVEAELPGVNAPAALSPDGRHLLAGGPLLRGEDASCVLIDVHAWAVVRTLPLQRPFVWIDDDHFIAQTPRWKRALVDGRIARTEARCVDPTIAAGAPQLVTADNALVLVDRATLTCRPLLTSRLLDEEQIAIVSPDRAIVFAGTSFSRISAVRISDGALLWQRPPSRVVSEGMLYAMALHPTRPELIAVGLGEHDARVIDPQSGQQIAAYAVGPILRRAGLPEAKRLGSMTVRADGLLAIGANTGVVIEVGADGRWIAYKAATKEIRALAFTRSGSQLVVGGNERNLRVASVE